VTVANSVGMSLSRGQEPQGKAGPSKVECCVLGAAEK
jgi:hypothetical protein